MYLKAHDFARKLLELPEDAAITYVETGNPICILVENFKLIENDYYYTSKKEQEKRLNKNPNCEPPLWVELNPKC